MNSIKHLETKYTFASYELITACEDYELRFYQFIKLHAINKGSAWPGSESICQQLGWSRDKLFRAIKAMQEKGHLVVISGKDRGTNNIYDITWFDQLNEGVRKPDKGVRKSDTPTNGGRVYGNQTQTNNKQLEINEDSSNDSQENENRPSPEFLDDFRSGLANKGLPVRKTQ